MITVNAHTWIEGTRLYSRLPDLDMAADDASQLVGEQLDHGEWRDEGDGETWSTSLDSDQLSKIAERLIREATDASDSAFRSPGEDVSRSLLRRGNALHGLAVRLAHEINV